MKAWAAFLAVFGRNIPGWFSASSKVSGFPEARASKNMRGYFAIAEFVKVLAVIELAILEGQLQLFKHKKTNLGSKFATQMLQLVSLVKHICLRCTSIIKLKAGATPRIRCKKSTCQLYAAIHFGLEIGRNECERGL